MTLDCLVGRNESEEAAERGQHSGKEKVRRAGDTSILLLGGKEQGTDRKGEGGIPDTPVSKQLRRWALEHRPKGLARERGDRQKKGTGKRPFDGWTGKNR